MRKESQNMYRVDFARHLLFISQKLDIILHFLEENTSEA